MSKLYKCVVTSSIRELPDRTEYLKCKSKKILVHMFKRCFDFKHSEYFGYYMATISEMKMEDFPEVCVVRAKCDSKVSQTKDDLKQHE